MRRTKAFITCVDVIWNELHSACQWYDSSCSLSNVKYLLRFILKERGGGWLTFFVRIFSAIDVADSRSNKSSIGGIDGPCSPCVLTKMNRTHKQMKRCNKFNATKRIDGFAALFAKSLALPPSPICCFVAIINVRILCVVLLRNWCKKLLFKWCRAAVIDLCKTLLNVPSALWARRRVKRRKCNGQKWCDGIFWSFTCTLGTCDLLLNRFSIATFSVFSVLFQCYP